MVVKALKIRQLPFSNYLIVRRKVFVGSFDREQQGLLKYECCLDARPLHVFQSNSRFTFQKKAPRGRLGSTSGFTSLAGVRPEKNAKNKK